MTGLALFGSTARGKASSGSDVDVLVSFDGPATSKRYFGVQFYLEDLFGCPVDLVTEKALRAELRPYIDQERVNVCCQPARMALFVELLQTISQSRATTLMTSSGTSHGACCSPFRETLYESVRPQLVEGHSSGNQGLQQAQPERWGMNQCFLRRCDKPPPHS